MGFKQDVKVLCPASLKNWMQVAACRILTLPVWRDVTPSAPDCIDGLEIREVLHFGPTQPSGRFYELGLDSGGAVSATRDLDRTTAAVNTLFIWPIITLELWTTQAISSILSVLSNRKLTLTFLRYGSISTADQSCVFHESKSWRWALLYIMKFVDDPPPRTPPHGTESSRLPTAADLFAVWKILAVLSGARCAMK